MVNTAERVPRNSPTYKEEKPRTGMDRRYFIVGGAALLAVAGFGGKSMVGGGDKSPITEIPAMAPGEDDEATTADKDPNSYVVSAEEAVARLNQIVVPNLFENRPLENPERLFDKNGKLKTKPELQAIAAIPINTDTQTAEGFMKALVQRLSITGNSGNRTESALAARELKNTDGELIYPVGEKDWNGNHTGNYVEFVDKELMSPMMHGGLFRGKGIYPDSTRRVEKVKNHLLFYAKYFEVAIDEPTWLDKATLYVTEDEAQELEASPGFSRKVAGVVAVRSPAIGGRTEDLIYKSGLVLDVDEGTDGNYLVAIHDYGGFQDVSSE